jgi:hypothetical protein
MNEPIRPNKAGKFPFLLFNASEGEHIISQVALGNMTQYRILTAKLKRGVFIAIEGVGAYEFQGFAHKGYVQDKLNIKHAGDAENIADFINDQMGTGTYERQGEYMAHLCRGEE